MAIRPNQVASTTTPPSVAMQEQLIRLEATAADAVGFLAWILPKNAIVVGIYTISTGANVAQTINVGITLGGIEFLNAATVNANGYVTAAAATGAQVGVQRTADTPIYAKASATLTNPVYVKMEYYIPQQGMSW